MKFRILEKEKYQDNNELNIIYKNKYYNIEVDNDVFYLNKDKKNIICIGKIFSNNNKITESNENNLILEKILSNFNTKYIYNNFFGKYILILALDNKIEIIADEFSQFDIYYTNVDSSVAISSDISLLQHNQDKEGYNQNALAHLLTCYGNRPAKKETIYNSVKRLGVLESIRINDNKFEINKYSFIPKKTKKYSTLDNEHYYNLFLDTLTKEGSNDGNLVYLSSGWDSTSILAGLVNVFGSDNVRAIIGRMKYSERSGICNSIEIEKAKKFADYYGVELNITDFDYAGHGTEIMDMSLPILKKHGFYNVTALNHFLLANAASKIINKDKEVIFAGEISDGAHNFGFSQYATIFHPTYEFREYADKMASYLFGPTFLKRIVDGDYKSDPIYKIFYSDANFIISDAMNDEKSIKANLFIDFYLRNGRKPFWSHENINILTSEGIDNYTDFHYKNYLSICEESNYENLYSFYLFLYNSFHWQGSTVATLSAMAAENNLKTCLPFWNKNIQDFLSKMPENWGRGLDLNNTKYPLKWMLKNKLDYPMELQEGPHSYTYDVDHSFNHYEEILYHSSLASDVNKVVSDYSFNTILSDKFFNLKYIDNLINRYSKKEKLAANELNEVFSLYFLARLESK